MAFQALSLSTALGVAFLYVACGAIYRLFFSPLAKFPGPRIAGLTFWYELYYDVIKRGSYVWRIEEMHKKYGPIIRINPHELHVMNQDADFLNQLYPTVGQRVDKPIWSAGQFGSTDMTFGTISHAVHRKRRAAFSQFFSKASIRRLEPIIQGLVDSLVDKVEAKLEKIEPVNLLYGYSALTQDIITEYCFADCRNTLDMKDFGPQYYDWMLVHCEITHMIKQFPYMIPMMNFLPDWFVQATNPAAWLVRVQFGEYSRMVKQVLQGGENDKTSHATVFHALRDDPGLPNSEKNLPRLVAEAASLVGAGTLTTAHTLSTTTYFVLENPTILHRLLAELDASDATTVQELEKLTYLNAVFTEGLRLSYGTIHRLSRVHPDNQLDFQGWSIPAGTPVGTTSYFTHQNEKVFASPRKFDPDRWLDASPEAHAEMTRCLGNFGRGTRQCVGMNLAYAEVYLTLASVFRRLGRKMKLHNTIRERDVDMVHDFFISFPRLDSKGVCVRPKEQRVG